MKPESRTGPVDAVVVEHAQNDSDGQLIDAREPGRKAR